MHRTAADKKIYEQAPYEQPQLNGRPELRACHANKFILEINGVTQCILGNTELLKMRHVHTLNHDAANYLLKIEKHTKDLVELLNKLQGTLHSDQGPTVDES